MAYTAITGQRTLMLYNTATLLSTLNALEASMSNTASVSSASNTLCIACIAASLPAFWPAHSWSEPLASTTSPLATFNFQLSFVLPHLCLYPGESTGLPPVALWLQGQCTLYIRKCLLFNFTLPFNSSFTNQSTGHAWVPCVPFNCLAYR